MVTKYLDYHSISHNALNRDFCLSILDPMPFLWTTLLFKIPMLHYFIYVQSTLGCMASLLLSEFFKCEAKNSKSKNDITQPSILCAWTKWQVPAVFEWQNRPKKASGSGTDVVEFLFTVKHLGRFKDSQGSFCLEIFITAGRPF